MTWWGMWSEVTGAFGSKDDFQSLSNDLSTFESTRKQLAQRIETLSSAKEAEIVRLRTDLKTAQAAIPAAPPKKIVVDDNEPPKKPAVKKKKPAAKPATPPDGADARADCRHHSRRQAAVAVLTANRRSSEPRQCGAHLHVIRCLASGSRICSAPGSPALRISLAGN